MMAAYSMTLSIFGELVILKKKAIYLDADKNFNKKTPGLLAR